MQYLLSQLSPPIVIGLIVAGVLVLVVVVLLARRLRRRQAPSEEVAPSLGGPIDYTSLPIDEEPSGWRDRFANLSLAGKILVILVPLLAILGILVLVLTLLPPSGGAAALPPAVEPTLSFVGTPALARVNPSQTLKATVRATGLPNGSELTVEMLQDGEPFPWLNQEQTRAVVRNGRAEIEATKAEGAPTPEQGRTYSLRVRTADNSTSQEANFDPAPYTAQFFGATAAVAPTATTAPTATVAPTAPAETPAPSPTAAPALPTGPAASVARGGNVRSLPFLGAENRVGGVNAGDPLQLITRTPNGEWYQVRFTNRDDNVEILGWISTSLLDIPAGTETPVASIVTVFQNGAVYERPDTGSTEVDRVNATADPRQSEVVELKQKTAAGDWYEVVNVRGITGWVPANLLGIPPEVAAQVPVAS